MKWEYFYENYGEWEEKKIINCVHFLEDIGPNEEIVDVVDFSYSEKANAELLKKALKKGVIFSHDEIVEMECGLDYELYLAYAATNLLENPNLTFKEIMKYKNDLDENYLGTVLYRSKLIYTQDELDEIENFLGQEFVAVLYKKQHMRYNRHDYVIEYSPRRGRRKEKEKIGLFARFGIYKLVNNILGL